MARNVDHSDPNAVSEARLRRFNRHKTIRTIVQVALLLAFVIYLVTNYTLGRIEQNQRNEQSAADSVVNAGSGEESRFIAISYPGLSTSTKLESKIVNNAVFEEQIQALRNSGYVTISQNDILNYYLYYGALPKKSLFLIFEDGIRDTTVLAEDILQAHNYRATVSTYANNLDSLDRKFISASDLKSLLNSGTWEMGTNGYRLSYINVFDRYNNYFGHLNGDEFVKIYSYLWRDYNHYLMDFKRDQDRLREETTEELRRRIKTDYDQMQSVYTTDIGYVPSLYILMHSNTGAFGTDTVASDANRENLTSLFAMNFNRQGTCLNTLESSIYDLSRLQVQSYFSTNHLLMRIKDDTGEDMAFVTGDEREADNWYQDGGVSEYKGNTLIVTTDPREDGRITLKSRLFSDLDMTVTLQGNIVGRQSVNLRTDRNLSRGIQVALENNDLIVRDLATDDEELFRQNLFEFDGGPFISEEEDEHNGLVALQQALIQYDEDPQRVEEAKVKLAELEKTPFLTLEDGGTPYYPVYDISDRDSRKLRVRLVGSRMSIWIDDKPVIEQLQVGGTQLGSISLNAEVYQSEDEEYSQRYLYDDVYDAIFVDPVVVDANNPSNVLYSYTLTPDQTINATITGWFRSILNFFVDNF